MTYGWAILIIAIVLVALFSLNLFNPYTFAPKATAGNCKILRPNGPSSNIFVSEVGLCNNEIPQYVASFNGTSYINLGSGSTLTSITTNMTITMWIKLSSSTISTKNILSSAGINCNGDYQITLNTPSAIVFGKCGVGDAYVGQSAIGTWYFIVGGYNDIVVYQYVDSSYGAFNYPSNTFDGAGPWYLGNGPQSSNIIGQITNVQLYNTSLSQPEITALYHEGIGGAPVDIQNLVGWWPLDGNSNDYSGNGNNGVPTNVVYTSNWENGYTTP